MAVNKMDTPNSGVDCVVSSCEYYMAGDHCAAEKIMVQPRHADTSNETDCGTFTNKNETMS